MKLHQVLKKLIKFDVKFPWINNKITIKVTDICCKFSWSMMKILTSSATESLWRFQPLLRSWNTTDAYIYICEPKLKNIFFFFFGIWARTKNCPRMLLLIILEEMMLEEHIKIIDTIETTWISSFKNPWKLLLK